MHITRPRLRPLSVDWRRVTATLLAIAGLVAAAAAWMGYSALTRTEPLIVASAAIPPGARISQEMLTVVQAPLVRPPALQGVGDASLLVGRYARVAIAPQQIVRADLVQDAPLEAHVYLNGDLPPALLSESVFELARTGVTTAIATDRINILVLVDAARGADRSFSVGAMDAPGSGSRVVRVLRDLRVLQVSDAAILLEVTPAQSQYLWALTASSIPFVGEISSQGESPLGPLRARDAGEALLAPRPTPEVQP